MLMDWKALSLFRPLADTIIVRISFGLSTGDLGARASAFIKHAVKLEKSEAIS